MKKTTIWLLILLLVLAVPVSSSDIDDSVGDDDLVVSGPLDEYAGLWIQEGADGSGTELQLDPGGTGHITQGGKSTEIYWKVEEGPFYVTVTVYDEKNDVLYEYQATIAGSLYDTKSGIRLVRPEPDNLEIISYDKAQNVERKTFMGTWEVTGMVVSVKEPRMTLPLGADLAYELMSIVSGIPVGGPLQVEFDVNAHMSSTRFGDHVDHHLPQLQYYFSGNALYIREMQKDFTMVFFYVGKDTLHMMVTPNPTPDAGTCVIIFERIAEPIMPWPEIGEEEEP